MRPADGVATGDVWVGLGSRQERWEFTLRFASFPDGDISWAQLLPPESVTGWLAIDAERGLMELDSSAGVPVDA